MDETPTCPYAPRHKPDRHGRCDWCMAEVPAPWFMRKPLASPAETAAQIAHKAGVDLPRHVAERIAEALLGYADAAVEIRQSVPREAWDDERFQQHARESMRRHLLDDVTSQGRIPASLPVEAIRYLETPTLFGREAREVPSSAVERGAAYEEVEVILAVTCRTPEVDRAAAVRAGVL